MPKGNPNPVAKWKPGQSANPKGYTREMRALKLEKQKQQNEYLNILKAEVTNTEFKAICKRAVQEAKQGDWRAREWITKFLAPEQPKQVEHVQGNMTAILTKIWNEPKQIEQKIDFIDGEVMDAGRSPEEDSG
jgi:hypothetical protein